MVQRYILQHIDIEINHRCNLACRHCSAKATKGRSTDELSAEAIKGILSKAKRLGLKKVGLTGGEPLSDIPKLETVAKFCFEELKVPIHLHTNGTIVAEEHCAPGNVLTFFEAISVTFLGGGAETHDGMTRVKGSFEKALRGTSIIAKAGLPLTCYFIPTHGTYGEFKNLAGELKEIGVKRIRAMALAPSGRARSIYGETAPLSDEIRQFEKDLLQSGNELGIHVEAGYCTRLCLPRLAVLSGHDKCMSGINRVHINSRGEVFPCTAAGGVKELKLGNLKDNGSDLEEIWKESEIIRIIRKVHNGGMTVCQECSRKPKCRAGCTVNACGTMSEEARTLCPLVNPRLRKLALT